MLSCQDFSAEHIRSEKTKFLLPMHLFLYPSNQASSKHQMFFHLKIKHTISILRKIPKPIFMRSHERILSKIQTCVPVELR